jgi:hypothetical protein
MRAWYATAQEKRIEVPRSFDGTTAPGCSDSAATTSIELVVLRIAPADGALLLGDLAPVTAGRASIAAGRAGLAAGGRGPGMSDATGRAEEAEDEKTGGDLASVHSKGVHHGQ